ncbi:MAG TPA: ATPase, T2SS/T4P/T4SS family, partial [Nakamurella sp.]|nr:ATPase, T2SS/T4P/T4SS family [Nakamurella sp.]
MATATATEHIHDEVRELIRRRGIDPVTDHRSTWLLIDEVIGHYEERVPVSALPPLLDRAGAVRHVFDTLAGFGPLQRYLEDPAVEEIWINQPGRVFVARHGRSELTTIVLTHDEVRDLVERMLKPSGRRLDLSSPFVDALLPDGSRLHAVIPDITREHLSLNIRKFVVAANGLEDLVALGTVTAHAARFLEAAVVAGLNIIVAGGTQAGKTTLLNTLINSIPARERVISCEEVFELRPNLPDVVAMQTRQPNLEGHGEIRLRRLVKEALRMRPSRIIVGEVRQEESLDLLIALNSGLPEWLNYGTSMTNSGGGIRSQAGPARGSRLGARTISIWVRWACRREWREWRNPMSSARPGTRRVSALFGRGRAGGCCYHPQDPQETPAAARGIHAAFIGRPRPLRRLSASVTRTRIAAAAFAEHFVSITN